MSNKNPFEIRTELLNIARDYYDQVQTINTDAAKRAFELAVSAGSATASDWKSFLPQMYTIDDVMKRATEMYDFVSTGAFPATKKGGK